MKITVDLTEVEVDFRGLRSKAENDEGFWRYAALQWWELYRKYVPMDTGMLTDNVQIRAKEIEHTQPYAHRLYEGTNFNFSREKHPKAAAHWDRAAAPTQLPKLAATLQQYIDSGRLDI